MEKTESDRFLPSIKEGRALNEPLEHKVENSVIRMLEERCREQGQELEDSKALQRQVELENVKLRGMVGQLEFVGT